MTSPRYRQIADELRSKIENGSLPPGSRLTEPALQETYEVSRNTVRQAIRELTAAGLLVTRGRNGTVVRDTTVFSLRPQSYPTADTPRTHDSWRTQVVKAGREPSQDFEMRVAAASESVKQRLQLTDPDALVCIRTVHRFIDGEPSSEEIGYYPMDIAEECGLITPHDIAEGCKRRIADHGYTEIGYQDFIWARTASDDERAAFALGAVGLPIMILDRAAWTAERPIRLVRQVLPSDRVRIVYELGELPEQITS